MQIYLASCVIVFIYRSSLSFSFVHTDQPYKYHGPVTRKSTRPLSKTRYLNLVRWKLICDFVPHCPQCLKNIFEVELKRTIHVLFLSHNPCQHLAIFIIGRIMPLIPSQNACFSLFVWVLIQLLFAYWRRQRACAACRLHAGYEWGSREVLITWHWQRPDKTSELCGLLSHLNIIFLYRTCWTS